MRRRSKESWEKRIADGSLVSLRVWVNRDISEAIDQILDFGETDNDLFDDVGSKAEFIRVCVQWGIEQFNHKKTAKRR